MSDRALGRRSIGVNFVELVVSYAFPLAIGAALGVGVAYLAVRPQWGDQTWLLFAAQRILEGGQQGTDLVEVNPPLIVWLTEIPAILGNATGIRLTDALQGCVIALAVLSIVWSSSLLRRAGDWRMAGWFAVLMVFATIVRPWVHYGQREHLMLLLAVPYLVMAAGRIDGRNPPAAEAFAAGLCAAIGLVLKPHHLVIFPAIEALILFRRRDFRTLFRPEMIAVAATGVGYIVAVLVWAPGYLQQVLPLALDTYYDYHRETLWQMVEPMRGLKIVLMVLLWAALYRWLIHRALATVLLLAGIGATIGCLLQMKGHEYQFVPVIGFFDLMFGTMVIDLWLQWSTLRTRLLPAGAKAIAAACMFVAATALCYPLQVARAAHGYTDARIATQKAISHYIPRGTTILFLSTSVETIFEQVLEHGWEWGSRFDCLWMLPGIVNAEHAAIETGTLDPKAAYAIEMTRNAVLADLVRWRPSPVFIERCGDTSIEPCMGMGDLRLGLFQWLMRDPSFSKAWKEYSRAGEVGPYDLWCRKGESDICDRILTGIKSGPSTSPL